MPRTSRNRPGIQRFKKTLVPFDFYSAKGVRVVTRYDGYRLVTSDNPYLRKQLAIGPIIKGNLRDPNDWSWVVYQREYVSGNMFVQETNPIYWTNYQGYLGNFDSGQDRFKFTYPTFDPDYLYNSALDRLNQKVRGELDLSVAAFEGRQTARMIAALRKARRYITGFGSKRMANEWLEFTYGWKPLASDIFGIADESVRYTLNRIKHVRARKSEALPGGKGTIGFSDIAGIPCEYVVNGKMSTTIDIRYECPAFDLARWSSLNPASIAWELMPYSFVVDWFVDVGGYLRNLETAMLYNCRFVTGYRSHLYICNSEYSVKNYVRTYTGGQNTYNLTGRESYKGFQRKRLTSYPFPRPPSFEANLGPNRLLSAAALLRQLIRR
jgi:hypothetical protein